MQSPYTTTVTISPAGIIFLICFAIILVLFIIFRRKLPMKPRVYMGLALILATGFVIGVVVDEYLLAKSGLLYRFQQVENTEPAYDCITC
ncbi:MAG: hypothetical protein JWM37_407 [Candidatus Saccharibacteria bacterium]|nr:hypothetical protein [Candidatus Saccharibacteria bacterium]